MKKYNVAIMGATGAVGQEFLNLIEERKFPFAELRLLASSLGAAPARVQPLGGQEDRLHGQGIHGGRDARGFLRGY